MTAEFRSSCRNSHCALQWMQTNFQNTRGTQENEVSGHADFQGQPQIYLPTSQNYVHEQNDKCFLYSQPQRFQLNESAHVMVKRKTLATDLSKRLGLAKSSFWSSYLLELWLKSTHLPACLLPNLCPLQNSIKYATSRLFHVVLLIRQINRSSQPPPALGHHGVTKAHQVLPCSIRWKAKRALRVGSPLPY